MAIFAYTGWMAFSGDGKYKNSVNYVKGMKALQDSNYAEAMKYLNKEIAKNPDMLIMVLVWLMRQRAIRLRLWIILMLP